MTSSMTTGDLRRFILPSMPRISPDGSQVVFVHQRKDGSKKCMSLWTVPADGSAPARAFTRGRNDSEPQFSPDGCTVAFIGGEKEEAPQVYLIPTAGGESFPLTTLPEGRIHSLVFAPDGQSIAFSFRAQDPEWTAEKVKERTDSELGDPPRIIDDIWYRLDGDGYFNRQRFRIYIVDLRTRKHRVVWSRDTLGTATFDFSPDARRLAICTNTSAKAMVKPWKDRIIILDLASGKHRSLSNLPDGPKTCVQWSPDGKHLAWAGREGQDGSYGVENLELWTCSIRGGGAQSLTADSDHCLMSPLLSDTGEVSFAPSLAWDPGSSRIWFTVGWQGTAHLASVSVSGGPVSIHTRVGSSRCFGNLSRKKRRIILTRSTCTTLPEVVVATCGKGTIPERQLTSFNRVLVRKRTLARIRSHWIRTPDGTRVQTWVMMPPGYRRGSRRRYPAILQVHGGPHCQYGVGFFHEFQVLAAQGWIVVFSNPRGSKGYGRDHTAAIKGNWGSADWTDIQAVRDFMQDHPNINPRRMGIMGGSYGGYMTNWAIGHCHDFAAAITDRCVSNLVSMGGNSDYVDEEDAYFPGNFWDNAGARWSQSPMKYIGNAITPTLIIHSEGDLRCNIEQAEQLFSALQLKGVPSRFVRYPRTTSHGMSRGGPTDMRIHRLEQIIQWWKRWL